MTYWSTLDRLGDIRIAPFEEVFLTHASVEDVAKALIRLLQNIGFVVESEDLDATVIGALRRESTFTMVTSNSIYHDSLCESQDGEDCAKPPRLRRIERRVSLAARVTRSSQGIVVAITPAVIKRYRREGGDFTSDSTAGALARPLCAKVLGDLKAVLRVR